MPQAFTTDPLDGTTDDASGHLSQLHKMSTTAGVTNQGYVAVNLTSITALLLGLLSFAAFLGWLLLIIPVIGIVFSILALRQIGNSSGTQTGRGMAWGGILLCVLFGGGVGIRDLSAALSVRGDEQKIGETIHTFGELIGASKYDDAYKLFDQEFAGRVKFDMFKGMWEQLQGNNAVGRVKEMQWNQVTPLFQSYQGASMAQTKAKVVFEKANEERYDVDLRKVGDKWLILRLPNFFPEAPPAKPGAKNDVFNF